MKSTLIAAALAAAFAVPTTATIIAGAVTGGGALIQGGTFVLLDGSDAFSVGEDNFQTPNLYGFDEDQNIVITTEITVNEGTNPQPGDVVASHYVFFDPLGTTTLVGRVTFDAPVYGIATMTDTLAASDFLANTNVTYLSPGKRGLESDSVYIDPLDPYSIIFESSASSPGDYVRVFTQFSPAAVPAPAALGLLGLGMSGLALVRRRRG